MPNSRRRKFSVKNNNSRTGTPKGATSESTSNISAHLQTKSDNNKKKLYPYSSSAIEPMEKVDECNENAVLSLSNVNSNYIVCSYIVASSSSNPLSGDETCSNHAETPKPCESKTELTELNRAYKDRRSIEKSRPKQYQHRARIRSPKISLVIRDSKIEIKQPEEITVTELHGSKAESHIETTGTNTELTQATPIFNTNVHADLQIRSLDDLCRVCHSVDLTKLNRPTCLEPDSENRILTMEPLNMVNRDAKNGKKISETVATNTDLPHIPVCNAVMCLETDRSSDHSLDDMCRICHGGDVLELGNLISACSCRGTVGRVHVKCLERWLTESGKSRCELCGVRYTTRRVHRYGVFRALVMWFLSQNAKQLMVDSLGIMLMSPLAVLAAWLSGRTLASLMTQESQVTPWPLASTFVLACMTLVCYYCWIVSAATRHALGWWIWYRSQYEVRLQMLDE